MNSHGDGCAYFDDVGLLDQDLAGLGAEQLDLTFLDVFAAP